MKDIRILIKDKESREFGVFNKLRGCDFYEDLDNSYYLRGSPPTSFTIVNRITKEVAIYEFIDYGTSTLYSIQPSFISFEIINICIPLDVLIMTSEERNKYFSNTHYRMRKELIYEGYKDPY